MKTALITGGSKGIGRATVEEFIKNGYQVITTSRSGKLPYKHKNLWSCQFLLEEGKIDKLFKYLESKEVQLNVLVNNAWQSLGSNQLQQSLDTNLVGTISFTKHMIPYLAQKSVVINVSSEYGSLMDDWGDVVPTYRITKAGLNMFTRTFYRNEQILAKGVRVYSFDPGWVKTDMGGIHAQRDPQEPAKELYVLAKSNKRSGRFYRGLKLRNW